MTHHTANLACRWFSACVVVTCVTTVRGEGSNHSAKTAYEALQSLEGTWKGESVVVRAGESKEDGTRSETMVTYKTIASGSSVIATFAAGTDSEMVSLYHLDGPRKLIHTHYCAVGNQPSMQFVRSPEEGLIKFDFLRGSNMDVEKDGHVHAGTMRLTDEGTLVTETEVWRDGKLHSTRYATLHRVE